MGPARFLTRRHLLLGLPAAMAVAGPVAAGDGGADITFRAYRKGSDIGRHQVSIRRAGDVIQVQVEIALIVRLAGLLPVYHYHHKAEETWLGGRLLRLVSSTDDDNDLQSLTAERAPDGSLRIQGSKFSGSAPPDIMPTSYWNPDFPRRNLLLDTQNGRLLNVQVTQPGEALPQDVPAGAVQYRLDGDLKLDIWYDAQRGWVKTRFAASDGSVVDYRLQE